MPLRPAADPAPVVPYLTVAGARTLTKRREERMSQSFIFSPVCPYIARLPVRIKVRVSIVATSMSLAVNFSAAAINAPTRPNHHVHLNTSTRTLLPGDRTASVNNRS
jgi:hypothetical protein